MDAEGGYLFSAHGDGTIGVVDSFTSELVARIPTGERQLTRSVAVTPDLTRAYVSTRRGELIEIDAMALQITNHIALPPDAHSFWVTANEDYAYVSDYVSNRIFAVGIDPDADDFRQYSTISVQPVMAPWACVAWTSAATGADCMSLPPTAAWDKYRQ